MPNAMQTISVSFSEVSFNDPGHYFIKACIETIPETKIATQRTEVSPSTTRPAYKNNILVFNLPAASKTNLFSTFTKKETKLVCKACRIDKVDDSPSVNTIGSASVRVFPNEALGSGKTDMSVVYFTSEDSVVIGKAILSLNISNDETETPARLDPIASYQLLAQSLEAVEETLKKTKSENASGHPSRPSSRPASQNRPDSRNIKNGEELDFKVEPPISLAKALSSLSNPEKTLRGFSGDGHSINGDDVSKSKTDMSLDILEGLVNESNQYQASQYTAKDMDQRQKLIDRLLEELDNRTDAIKKVGNDLFKLREVNSAYEKRILDLQKKVEQNEITNSKILNTIDLDLIQNDDLKRRYAVLANKFQASLSKEQELTEKLEKLQEKLIDRNDLEKRMLEIQQAHTAQQAYVQKLQDKLSDLPRYKSAIKIQEQVIKKLEVMIDAPQQESSKEPNNLNTPIDDDDSLEWFKRELEEERSRLGQMDGTYLKEQTKEMDEISDFKYLLRAEKAEARVRALEEELSNNAKEFAIKLEQLRTGKQFQA